MKIKKVLLFIIIGIFCFVPVVVAKDDIVIKSVKLEDFNGKVILNSMKKVDVEFNDLNQEVQYKVVLKNNAKKDLYINSLQITGSSQNFIKYTIDEASRSKVIKTNGEEEIFVNIKTVNEKQAGKNLSNNINFKLLFNDSIKNPQTSSNLITTIILVIISAVAITFVMTKFNTKKGTIATVIVCFMLLGTSFVFADDTKIVEFTGKVKYSSQNYLETSGRTISSGNIVTTNAKDMWASTYYDKVKNINISTENNNIETYAHTFDITTNDKQRVKAYLVENGDQNIPYDLYIISNGVIYAPEDSTGLFSFSNVEIINGFENIIFDNTINMTGMFAGNEKLQKLDITNLNTINVINTSYMFYRNYRLDLKESSFNLEKVENKTEMFSEKQLYKIIEKSVNGYTIKTYMEEDATNFKNKVYYYYGNPTNNYVKFANFCWRIVRTTDTGGVKLIYNGAPNSTGSCNNGGTATSIGTSVFNSGSNSPAYVGYMYGSVYNVASKDLTNQNEKYLYGNDVTWDGKNYKLSGYTKDSSSWSNDRATLSTKYHYTCFNDTGICQNVYYINYFANNNVAYYLTLKDGKNIENAKDEMFANTTSSTIKTTIDNWYKENMNSYTNRLEDTIWCNDRTLISDSLYSKDTNSVGSSLFATYGRIFSEYKPLVTCSNIRDSFTVSDSKGNGKLTYPVGLLTADEIALARGGSQNHYSYLYVGIGQWSLSPSRVNSSDSHMLTLYNSDVMNDYLVYMDMGVRPSVSLKYGINVSGGDGSYMTPYIVE